MAESDSEQRHYTTSLLRASLQVPAPSSTDRKDVVKHCLEFGAACEKSEPRAGHRWTVLCSRFSIVVTYTEFQH